MIEPKNPAGQAIKQTILAKDKFWLTLILLGAVLIRLWYGSFIIDDAYITFRYSRNLVNGLGLVYNPDGRHILGTTTPLLALLLALPNYLGIAPEGASLWLSLFSDSLTISLLYLISRDFLKLPRVGLAAGVLVAFWPDYINYAVSGMETSLYIALLVGMFYLYLRQRYVQAGLVLGLLFLARPDGLIMGAVLFGDYLLKERRLPWRMGLAFLPLPILWFTFATFYYGNPISQSVLAKATYNNDNTPSESFIQLLIFLLQSFKPILTILAALGIFTILRSQNYRGLRLPLVWWSLYCVIFIATGAFHYFPWYYIPLLPFYFLFALIGVVGLSQPLIERLGHPLEVGIRIGGGLLTGGLVWLALANKPTLAESQIGREVLYQEVATRLLKDLPPNEQFATKEIGTLAYFCNCQTYDLAGLVTPEALNRPELPLLQEIRPAFIIVYNNHLRADTLNSAWLKQNYETMEVHPVKLWGQEVLYVFRRRPTT
ncbi:MAG: hypothetical protein WCS37_16585 [Chloroflexota bacterium]|nr:hypothetical protein [Chloroflexota bacterium]